MKTAAPVDELLLQTLERFTRRAPDAPFRERWRAEVVLLEQELATAHPRPRPQLDAHALDTPHMRDRLNAVAGRWRSLLSEAVGEHGLLLGLDSGHARLLSAIDSWLTSWEATSPSAGRASAATSCGGSSPRTPPRRSACRTCG